MERVSHRGGDYRERHGLRHTDIYHVWLQMIQRCHNEKNKSYYKYGGRGIFVAQRWKESFIEFYNDMFSVYRKGLEIDRLDNDGPYSFENCKWRSINQNMSNRRNFGKYMKGVVGRTSGGKFISRITIDKIKYSIGCFDSEIDAHNAFMYVHKEWYGE